MADAWSTSEAYLASVGITSTALTPANDANITDGTGAVGSCAAGVLGAGTYYDYVAITLVAPIVIASITAALIGGGSNLAASWDVLMDGAPAAGTWTVSDDDNWTDGSSSDYATWRPAVPKAGIVITLRRTYFGGGYEPGWDMLEALVRRVPGQAVAIAFD